MRCGCPHCNIYMIQSEGDKKDCCCPECGHRCDACQGTNSVISPQDLRKRAEELEQKLFEGYVGDDLVEEKDL